MVLFMAYGAQYSFGVFFAALLDEFGWSRARLAGIFSIYAVAYCIFAFPAGRLTDRWGPTRVIAAGGVFLGAALAGMALVTELWQPYLLYGLLAGLGMGTAYVPCNTTVVKWFVARRGLAVGLASSGGSVGTFALPPLAQLLISGAGWRTAYVVFGAAAFVALTAAARLMRRDPESMGLTPDGFPAGDAAAVVAEEVGWPLARAARTGTFWLLATLFTSTWIPVFIPLVHLVSLARDRGHSPLMAAWIMSLLGVGAVAGRLGLGYLSDRLGRKSTIGASLVLQAVAFLAFLPDAGVGLLTASAVIFGFSYGGISTLFPAMVGDFFGRRHAGAIVGLLFALAGSMTAVGPVIAGAVYDATGGYGPAFVASAALNVVALVLLAVARPPRATPAGP